MPSGPDTEPSPKKGEPKLQEGRIQKSRVKKAEAKSPNYRINGRTFACEGCKNGHRVSKCTHALQRPLHMTNDPGRPSADQRRHCDCPKQCSCTKKKCKCARNCTCTQIMYMLVYIPVEDGEQQQEKDQGEWRIGKEVITDLKGNALSAEEIEGRAQLKFLQQNGKTSRASTVGTGTLSPPSESTRGTTMDLSNQEADNEITGLKESSKPGCCRHRKNMEHQSPSRVVKKEEIVGPPSSRPQCNCGPGCKCAFCLDHPNNQTSQRIAQQRAAQFAENDLNVPGVSLMGVGSLDYQEAHLSCMGTSPQFAWHTSPNPSSLELQNLFGHDSVTSRGYCLSYPVKGYSTAFDQTQYPQSMPILTEPPYQSHLNPSSLDLGIDPMATNPSLLTMQHSTNVMPQGFLHDQQTSTGQLLPSPSLHDQTFFPDHAIGQATVAGIYGMGNTGTEWNVPIYPPATQVLTPDWCPDPPLQDQMRLQYSSPEVPRLSSATDSPFSSIGMAVASQVRTNGLGPGPQHFQYGFPAAMPTETRSTDIEAYHDSGTNTAQAYPT